MNREHLDTEGAGGFDRSRDGIGDVVQFEIKPDPGASGQNGAHDFRAFRRKKLEADFEEGDIAAKLLNKSKRFFSGRNVECDDDFVVCHVERIRDISASRPTTRDSSTSLGMTEQIARYASPRSR
jgi:hypothetical protein